MKSKSTSWFNGIMHRPKNLSIIWKDPIFLLILLHLVHLKIHRSFHKVKQSKVMHEQQCIAQIRIVDDMKLAWVNTNEKKQI